MPAAKVREGFKYIGPACCGKIRLRVFEGLVIGACPDHPPIIIVDGKIEELKVEHAA